MKRLLLATSIVVTVAASCTDTVTQEDPPPPETATPSATADAPSFDVSDPPAPAIELAGTSWVLAIVDGGDWPVGDDPDITLEFHDRQLVGFSGCNHFSANWQMVEGHVEIGHLISTLAGCRGTSVGWSSVSSTSCLRRQPSGTAD